MAYHFTTATRYASVRAHKALTAPWVVTTFIAATVLAILTGWLVPVMPDAIIDRVAGLTLILGSVAGLALSAFTFGATYFPFIKHKYTVAELLDKEADESVWNVADAADFSLIAQLAEEGYQADVASLPHSLDRIWADQTAQKCIMRLLLPHTETINAIREQVVPKMTWEELAERTLRVAASLEKQSISAVDFLGAWLLHPALQPYLRQQDIQEQDVLFVLWWQAVLTQERNRRQQWWDPENLLRFTGLGLSWASGFTPLLDRLIHVPAGDLWDLIPLGREDQIDELITTLARERQSNVLLVGAPGAGRLGVIKEVARRIHHNQAHPSLNGLRVAYVHVGQLLALANSNAEQLSVISRVLNEMERAGNIIAVLDGVGSVLGEQGEQRMNLTDVLLPFFSSLTVKVVALVSSEEYHTRLSHNQELIHFFEIIQIPPMSEENTLRLLALTSPLVEKRTNLFIPYRTLEVLVDGTSSIIPHIPFPERAFDVLEEALVMAIQQKQVLLDHELIQHIISRKVGVDIGRLRDEERERLLQLEDLMHKRVVNQNNAIKTVVKAMVRARAQVRSVKRPIGTFLFLGPTGVGKTETAKTLAEAYFGSEKQIIRFDMSEFHGEQGVEHLIGSPSRPHGRLTDAIADRPFAVLLLDEFEKAATEVHNLFLQVFDEGHLTDARGQLVSFKHLIIIATSNAGAEFIRESVNRGPLPEDFDKKLREHILAKAIFRPELVNRFDGVVTFTPLTPEHIQEVAVRMLRLLNARLDAQHGIQIDITPELISFLVEVGYHPEFGARPMARAIQDTVEYYIARKIIGGNITPGQTITINPNELRSVKN